MNQYPTGISCVLTANTKATEMDLNRAIRRMAKDDSEYNDLCELVNLYFEGYDTWDDMPTVLQLTIAEWENEKPSQGSK